MSISFSSMKKIQAKGDTLFISSVGSPEILPKIENTSAFSSLPNQVSYRQFGYRGIIDAFRRDPELRGNFSVVAEVDPESDPDHLMLTIFALGTLRPNLDQYSKNPDPKREKDLTSFVLGTMELEDPRELVLYEDPTRAEDIRKKYLRFLTDSANAMNSILG